MLLVEYGDFQALFAGDAGFPAERRCAGRLRRVDLLKVGHHGSRGSTGDDWLDCARADGGGDLGRPERLRASGAGHAGRGCGAMESPVHRTDRRARSRSRPTAGA